MATSSAWADEVVYPQPTGEYDNQLTQNMGYTGEVISRDVDVGSEKTGNILNRVANDFRDAVHNTSNRIQKWWFTRPEGSYPRPVPASYCYRALQDILCYRAPMPGWEHRLVGYQGTNAPAPPPAMMQPLPTRVIETAALPASASAEESNTTTTFTPAAKASQAAKKSQAAGAETPSHVSNAKPVFVEMPPEPKINEKEEEAVPTADAAHETLPDPALAPQL